MAGKPDEAMEQRKLQTLTTDRRRLIGQAIIDGLLTPAQAAFLPMSSSLNYNQSQGNYTQRGGGEHVQSGNGDYNQAPALLNREDLVTDVIRELLIEKND